MSARKFTRCGFNGCRKKALKDGLCTKHAPNGEAQVAAPVMAAIDGVLRVTELEAAQFLATDSEIRNAMSGRRIVELEMAAAERAIQDAIVKHRAEQDRRKQQYDVLGREIESKKAGYLAFVKSLAEKYHVAFEHMMIDPDSRIIREGRVDNKS